METQLDIFTVSQHIPDSAPGLYHNTLNLIGEVLKNREVRAGSQNGKILQLLRDNPDKSYTPWDIVRAFGWPERMKVSAGRALTDLTKMGYLVMTGDKRMEVCGDENNCWKVKPKL